MKKVRAGDPEPIAPLAQWEKAHPEATTHDLVRRHFPLAGNETCEYLLWEHTTFPLGLPEQWDADLAKLAKERAEGRVIA